ncbi:hypothetical protein [Chlorogloeopsis fritschii]|uniref:hypothetical protein n=1 Tax=Chlorogloeopsis fritschii TaxID=1124 RepID=UPI000F8DB63C|nr:hypothetical protein [Chlorogloeopsis fritschii]
MRKSIKDWLFCRYPHPCSCVARIWSQDATKQPRNSSQHRIKDYGVGLLAGLVELTAHPCSFPCPLILSLSDMQNQLPQNTRIVLWLFVYSMSQMAIRMSYYRRSGAVLP